MNTLHKLTLNSLVINTIILIVLLLTITFWSYPNFTEIQAKKETFAKTYEKYQKIEKQGLDFGILKSKVISEINKQKKNKIGKEKIISDLESVKNSNTTFNNLLKEKKLSKNNSKTFLKFLEEKNLEIKQKINSNENVILEKKIENILPSYLENDEEISTLTNFKFINYLENLFFAFNLKNKGNYGIGDIVAIDNFGKNNTRADQIFYIPVKLKLEGKKGNIINFLYYLENVGRIKLEKGKTLKINFYNDNFFDKNYNVKKYLSSSKIYNFREENKQDNKVNIYNNLFTDIKEIKFNEYLDNKFEEHNSTSEKSFIEYLQNDQFSDKYKLDLTIKIYIKGLPRYKLVEEIIGLIADFNNVSKNIKKELKIQETKKLEDMDVVNYAKLSSLNKFLDKKKKDILRIKKSLNKEKDLIKIYNSTKDVKKKLIEAKKIFKNIKEKTDIKKGAEKNISKKIEKQNTKKENNEKISDKKEIKKTVSLDKKVENKTEK